MSELLKELERLGVREFEVTLFSADPERGWAALQSALAKNADNPVRYAMKLLEDPAFRPQRPRHAVNLSVDVECAICGGDRFVVVNTRKPKQSALMQEQGIVPRDGWETKEGWVENVIEEMAPCPQCGPKL